MTADVLASPPAAPAALEIEGLRVTLGRTRAVDGVGLSVARGEILALVGPSGSGKSAFVRAVLGLVETRPGIVTGRVLHRLEDGAVVELGPGRARGIARLRRASGLVLQSGRAALEPGRPLRALFAEVLGRRRPELSAGDRPAALEAALDAVELPPRVLALPPEALSGGMAQRAMLALAELGAPERLFLDEPTTGLDTALRAKIVDLLAAAHARRGFTGLLVTHDPGIGRALAHRVAHVAAGRVIETAPATTLRPLPRLDSAPRGRARVGALVLELSGVSKRFGDAEAARDVDLEVPAGTIVGLVGASGSGKTTLARLAVGLERPAAGTVRVCGEDLEGGRAPPEAARILFQNPYASLNPQDTGIGALAESLRRHEGLSGREARRAAERRLESLGLAPARWTARIQALSGGERRRVALARALVGRPRLLVLDEPATGVDPERREAIAAHLAAARAEAPERGILLVAHDLGFVRAVADAIVVLHAGRVVDRLGPRELERPEGRAPETRRLLEAAARVRGAPALPS